jgi:hypothetical protein
MITISSNKWFAFFERMSAVLVFSGTGFIINNLGASGLVSSVSATLIVAVLGVFESSIGDNGSALFGAIRKG